MDRHTIFNKTTVGEEAVRQRTRLVQRNLRNILIMVDGQATVRELSKRFGDRAAAEAALAELERKGYIESLDSVVAAEVQQAALRHQQNRKPADEPDEDIPVLTTPAPHAAVAPHGPEPMVEPVDSGALTEPPAPAPDTEPAADSVPPLPPFSASQAETIDLPEIEEYFSQDPHRSPPSPSSATKVLAKAVEKPGLGERIKGLFARRPAAGADENDAEPPAHVEVAPVSIRPIRRGGGRGLSAARLFTYVFLALAVGLALLAVFYPYDQHLPTIARHAMTVTHDKVTIGHIGFAFSPQPAIRLENISVGDKPYLTVRSLRAVPDPLTLFSDRTTLRAVQAEDVVVHSAGLARLARWSGTAGLPVEISRIGLSRLSLETGGVERGELGGEVALGSSGIEEIKLANADHSLKLELRPKGEGFALVAGGAAWKAPIGAAWVLDHLDAEGVLTPGALRLTRFDARAYEGSVAGTLTLDWSESAAFAGAFEMRHINFGRLAPALDPSLRGEGELAASLRLEAGANSLAALEDNLRAQSTLELRRGAVRGIDLVETVRSSGRGAQRGGATRFEQLTADLRFGPAGYQFNNLRLSSGPLRASGSAILSPDKRLSGVIDVELRGSANVVRTPVSLAGGLKDPQLFLGRSGGASARP